MSLSETWNRQTSNRWATAGILVLAFLALFGAQLLFDRDRSRYDQDTYHLPTIQAFASQLPQPDFHDYPSATTPGYHLPLAVVYRYLTHNISVLRAFGAIFTIGLLLTLGASVGSSSSRPIIAALLCMPMVASLYVFSSGAWLLPDNAGWWGVLAILLLALRPRTDVWTYIGGGLLLLATVLIRQSHLWAATMIWAAAWLGDGHSAGKPQSGRSLREPVRRACWMLIASAPAFIAVAWFAHIWHGLVPPLLQSEHKGPNAAVPAMVFAVFGVTGLFFVTFLLPTIVNTPSASRRLIVRFVLAGMLVGLIVSILPKTNYSYADGRSSGLWNIALKFPTFANRSPLMIGWSVLGGGIFGLWLGLSSRRDGWILVVAWIAFIAAQSVNATAWQRYYEPFALVTHAIVVTRAVSRNSGPTRIPMAVRIAGPVLLTCLLAAVTVLSF